MKNSNKASLDFKRATIVELNDDQINSVNGGSVLETILFSISVYVEVTFYLHENHK